MCCIMFVLLFTAYVMILLCFLFSREMQVSLENQVHLAHLELMAFRD